MTYKFSIEGGKSGEIIVIDGEGNLHWQCPVECQCDCHEG